MHSIHGALGFGSIASFLLQLLGDPASPHPTHCLPHGHLHPHTHFSPQFSDRPLLELWLFFAF